MKKSDLLEQAQSWKNLAAYLLDRAELLESQAEVLDIEIAVEREERNWGNPVYIRAKETVRDSYLERKALYLEDAKKHLRKAKRLTWKSKFARG